MLRIAYSDYETLRAHGEETYPNECCGVLLGKNIAEDHAAAIEFGLEDKARDENGGGHHQAEGRDGQPADVQERNHEWERS